MVELKYKTYVEISESRKSGVAESRYLCAVVQHRAAAVGRHKRSYNLKKCGLAGPAWPDNGCDTPGLNIYIDTLQHLKLTKCLPYITSCNQFILQGFL